ncbi:UNVERIFIED_CONTAM: hypothetical protein K2H54_001272 [Gekko kuhli]
MEANGSGSSSDSAPDCWDQADPDPGSGPVATEEEEAPGPAAQHPDDGDGDGEQQLLGAAFSRHLNVNAKPFVPNVHAAEFVPACLRGGAAPAPPPAPAHGFSPPYALRML